MSNTTEQIKERLNIVDVVSQYVKLQKAGKNYRGLSPFKKEKTPSFFVSPERNAYYCFSSNKGGDIFTFVQEMEGMDFRGSLKILAERAGVELVPENPKTRDQRARLYAVLDETAKYFEEVFSKNGEIKAYLSKRGLTEESVKKWRIGYAPRAGGEHGAWDKTRKHLESLGYTTEELVQAGLIKKGEKGGEYYDQFRGRIMFPIFDASGRIVAYSGRLFPDGEDIKGPKYLNSPETQLYDKSRILYGYDKAKNTVRRYNFSIIVEGQMDLVMSHQGGFPNTVAVSGTGLTEYHLDQLSRLSTNVVMAFDADSAGIASVERGARMALRRGMDVKVAKLPSGTDPADIVMEDPEKWKEAIRSAKHIIEFYLGVLAEKATDKRRFELLVREKVLPFVLDIKNKMDQAHFVAMIASKLGMKEEPIWYELARTERELEKASASEYSVSIVDTEREEGKTVLSRKDSLIRTIAGIILSQRDQKDGIDTESLFDVLSTVVGEATAKEALAQFKDSQELFFEIEVQFESTNLSDGVNELISDLRREVVREDLASTLEEIRIKEGAGEGDKVAELMRRYQELSKSLRDEGSGTSK